MASRMAGEGRVTVSERNHPSGTRPLSFSVTHSLGLTPRRPAARLRASRNTGVNSSDRDRTMAHTLRVLQTLRSSELRTDLANLEASAPGPATIHPPPVPCRLTEMPLCRATDPSWPTARPDPRATASESLGWENNAQPTAWVGLSTRPTAPSGSPVSTSAGSRACSTMARAVPSAADPIRKTTVLPERSTPVASANTLGRPSNTNPTTPRPDRTNCASQPVWGTFSMISPRPDEASRQVRKPSTMSARILGDSTSRVVVRPRAWAFSTSVRLASAMGAKALSSASSLAKAS